jgi:IPT/TIG domain-containing protein
MRKTIVALLLIATSALAAPVATSISPNNGRVPGGETITIKGSGFTDAMVVLFGRTPARGVRVIDATTIEATVPPLLPSRYDISVQQADGSFTLRSAFGVAGEPSEGFETILLPIYVPTVFGAFGSEFHTIARASNKLDQQPVQLYGADYRCLQAVPVTNAELDPTTLDSRGTTVALPTDCSNWPARLVYVPHDQERAATLNLRVADISNTSANHGTEIPIVRSEELRRERIVLL